MNHITECVRRNLDIAERLGKCKGICGECKYFDKRYKVCRRFPHNENKTSNTKSCGEWRLKL